MRGGGGIPLLQNPALITACLLHTFHPHGWHRLQTRAVGEASKIKSTFIPTLANEKPWRERLLRRRQQCGCSAREASRQPSRLTTAAAAAFGNSLLLGWRCGGGTVEKQPLADRGCFWFRSLWENLPQHRTLPHGTKLSATRWGAQTSQGALICLSLSWEKSHLSSLLPAPPGRI